ncbi:MAG TPA: hypothetical protein VLI93_17315 [Acetobacteraceae bacterium]|nr:hypothetical protein [Acetobacteraceae bacterium]
MPLDDLGGRGHSFILTDTTPCSTLAEAVRRLELKPVAFDLLDAHRREQVRRHPASFLFRHRWIAPLLTVSSFAVSVAGAALVGTSVAAVSVILAGMLPALAGIVLASRKVRGEAYWVEKRLLERELATAKIPALVRGIAHAAKREFPPARLILGELRQDTVVLDPYLIAEYGDDRIVLGIWDGDQVIACAEWASDGAG